MKVFITGTAGFIGYHLAEKLLTNGFEVLGIDNINDYYDVHLKCDRLAQSGIIKPEDGEIVKSLKYESYRFINADIQDKNVIDHLFKSEKIDVVINLAAQAGVRYSLENPQTYLDNNITGFLNILEGCRNHPVEHLIYASSSSVYGSNKKMPFKTSDKVDHPVSLYATSKKTNELMAHTYSHLFEIPTTGLRFFTVYGPWGRPDMALFLFTKAIIEGKDIDVYNYGKMSRDFTYIGDIVDGIHTLIDHAPKNINDDSESLQLSETIAPYQLFNIGFGSPVKLMDFIREIEKNLGIEAKKNMMPIQPGDVPKTWADVSDLHKLTGFKPQTSIEIGIKNFINWYLEYYNDAKNS
ncbi:MAG: NAD-dependent epimerase [Candidatus Paceibacterota bacterium]